MSEAERLNIHLSARDKELAQAIDRSIKRIARLEANAKKSLSGTSRAFDRMGKSAKASASGMGNVINMSGSGRFVLQNTAAQLGDIAVQLESGTNASRVMAQQLPQLLGGFGALGGALGIVAPLLGTVAAVGIPLAAMFMTMGGDAEDASEKVETFADKLGEAEAALGRAEAALAMAGSGGLESLKERYGEVTLAVRELADALAEIELRAATVEVGQMLDAAMGPEFDAMLEGLAGTVGAALANAGTEGGQAMAEEMRMAIKALEADIAIFENSGQAIPQALTDQLAWMREELAALEGDLAGIGSLAEELIVGPDTTAALAELQNALKVAAEAGDFAAVADALAEVRTLLIATGAELDQAVMDGLVRAEDQSRQMAARLKEGEEAAQGVGDAAALIAGGLSPAVQEAAKLAENLGISLGLAQRLAKSGLGNDVVMDPRAPGYDPRKARLARIAQGMENMDYGTTSPFDPSRIATKKGGSKGRKSGGRSAKTSPEARAYERTLERLDRKTDILGRRSEGYREELERLRTEHEAGRITGDEFEVGLDRIEDAFQRNARAAESLKSQAQDAFAAFVTGAKSAREALGDLLSTWASMAAKSAFGSLFSSGAGGGLFSALGELIGFDGGGYTGNAPRSGGLDGKGGFLAMMHPRESVIDHTKGSTGASGGGASDLNINITVSGARGNSEITQMVEQGVRQGLQEYDRNVLPRSVRGIQSDPRRIG